MEKIYIVKISCSNCPNIDRHRGYRYCRAVGGLKIEDAITAFPDWCPLETASNKAIEPTSDVKPICKEHYFTFSRSCAYCDEPE